MTYLFSYALFHSSLVSLAASFILLLSPIFIFEYLRIGDEHATFALFYLVSLYFFWIGRHNKKYFYFSSIAFSLAFLTYGFGALFIPLAIIIYLVISGEIKTIRIMSFLIYLFVASVIIMPWFIFQYIAQGVNFFKIYLAELVYYFNANILMKPGGFTDFLGKDLVSGMANCIDASFFRSPDFYINVIRFAFYPWWIALVFYVLFNMLGLISKLSLKGKLNFTREGLFIFAWLIPALTVLFIFGDKMSWRIYLLFPALAIAAAKSLKWFYAVNKSGFITPLAIFFLILFYSFRLIPVCSGPECLKYIELYGFPTGIQPLVTSCFDQKLFFLLATLFLILCSGYIFFRKEKNFLRKAISLIFITILLLSSLKNVSAFLLQEKAKSDIYWIVGEIKNSDRINKLIILDPILYKMNAGLIVPEYSLGGAATGNKGKHRWDTYYLIGRLGIEKEFINNFNDLGLLIKNNPHKGVLVLINKYSINMEESVNYKYRILIERGDYKLILIS
jgi:hypothetical protein